MAVNQVSLFFYPPRWQQRLTRHPTAITDEGNLVQIAHSVPVANANGPTALPIEVKEWLAERRFTAVEWGQGSVFERGQVRSIFGPEKEVEVSIGEEAGEVTELTCRFTLPRRTPPPLSEWAGFVVELCDRFRLRLGAEGVVPCSESEFLAPSGGTASTVSSPRRSDGRRIQPNQSQQLTPAGRLIGVQCPTGRRRR